MLIDNIKIFTILAKLLCFITVIIMSMNKPHHFFLSLLLFVSTCIYIILYFVKFIHMNLIGAIIL